MTFLLAFGLATVMLFLSVVAGILTWDFREERAALLSALAGSATFVAFLYAVSRLLAL